MLLKQLRVISTNIVVRRWHAGCIVANRCRANPANRVLILEAGGNGHLIWFHIPVGYCCDRQSSSDWMFRPSRKQVYQPRSLCLSPRQGDGGLAINATDPRAGQAAVFMTNGVSSPVQAGGWVTASWFRRLEAIFSGEMRA